MMALNKPEEVQERESRPLPFAVPEAYHILTAASVAAALGVDPSRGLNPSEVEKRRKQHGPNALQIIRPTPAWRLLLNQFASLMVALLAFAAAVSWATSSHAEALAIIVVLILNALVGFATEWQSRRALDALRRQSRTSARVKRDGHQVSLDAEIAFQKVECRACTGKLTADELAAIRTATRPAPLESGYFHIEVDLRRQVLFVVEGSGLVSKILPVSSGSGKPFTSEGWTRRAITPTGRFTVSRKIAGWRKSPLGLLYYPVYILNGIAIHGNPSVPMVPASHGCIRIPMFAAKQFSEMIPAGTRVLVHDGSATQPDAELD